MRNPYLAFVVTVVLVAGGALAGESVVDEDRTRATLALKDGTQVTGILVRLDDEDIVLTVVEDRKTVPVEQVEPISLYMARRQVMDLSKADVHVELGRYCLIDGLSAPAEREFSEALRLDASLADRIRQIRAEIAAPARVPAGGGDRAEEDPGARRPTRRAEAARPTSDEVARYEPATPEVAAEHRRRADSWAEQIAAFCKRVHLVETDHFLIYSCWARDNDKALSEICERMYKALCQQFDIPESDNMWAGKCPIYLFCEKADYVRFCTEVYKSGLADAAGFYCQEGKGFVFIAIGPTTTRDWFYEVLIHEGTHGFLSRYRTNRNPPSWVHEGIADTLVGTLLPASYASRKLRDATRQAVRGGKPFRHVFDDVGPNGYDYGVAQSFVRYLIQLDRKAFIRFVQLMKDGKTDEEAMKEAYGFGKDEFASKWLAAAGRGAR